MFERAAGGQEVSWTGERRRRRRSAIQVAFTPKQEIIQLPLPV